MENKITRDNYEIYFLDYYDRNLSHTDVAELMLFLSMNPDLDREFNDYAEFTIKPEMIEFNFKNQLKKSSSSITGNSFHDKCIARIENDLTEEEIILFDQEIKSDLHKKKEFISFEKSVLKSDESIIYPDKESLKKELRIKTSYNRFVKYTMAIPAIILLTLIFLPDNNTTNHTYKQTSSISDIFSSPSVFVGNVKDEEFQIVRTETPSIVSKSINEDNTTKSVDKTDDVVEEEVPPKEYEIETINPKVKNEIASVSNYAVNPVKQSVVHNSQNTKMNSLKYLADELKSDQFLDQMMQDFEPENNIDKKNSSGGFWSIAASSLERLTKITDAVEVKKVYMKNGKSKLAINGNNFNISTSLKENE